MATSEPEAAAERFNVASLATELADAFEDVPALRTVAYYAPGDTGVVFLREDVHRTVDREDRRKALEDAVLESIAVDTIEDHVDDELVGTVRVFEEQVVVYCCAHEHRGVVVAFDREPPLDYRDVVAEFEALYDGG